MLKNTTQGTRTANEQYRARFGRKGKGDTGKGEATEGEPAGGVSHQSGSKGGPREEEPEKVVGLDGNVEPKNSSYAEPSGGR